MALDFPASPNINDTYTFGGVTWTWDGTTWKVLGRFQFTSSETDPVFSASPAFSILNQNITNWNDAYGWGDHATAGYLSSLGSIAGHTDVNIATLQDAQLLRYSVANSRWENWTPDYLTAYTETDPVFTASPAGGITGTNIANWNTAYGWGDHGVAGYLTAEADTLETVVSRGNTATGLIIAYGGVRGGTLSSGNSNDVQLSHNNSTHKSTLQHLNTFSNFDIKSVTDINILGGISEGGGVNLSHTTNAGDTPVVRLTTTSTGVTVTGDLNFTGDLYQNGVLFSGGGGGANVTISDTAPGSASAGDLWWESDKGRLKIYYNDTDSTQWVDASPPLADATSIGGQGTVSMKASIIPDTNAAYDIGSAEYKIRDLYLDSGSIHTPSEKNLSFYDGNLTWGGDDVIMLQDLKDMMATATSFEDFKNAIMGL